jgi:hypothetical protein
LESRAIAESTIPDLSQHLSKRRTLLLKLDGSVQVVVPEPLDLGREVAEEEDVLGPDLLRDLDVRAVDGTDEEPAVQAELHVRRPGRLSAGRRDVLGDVRGRDEKLRQRHGVVGEEEDLEVLLCLRVGVDDPRGVDDETDGQLGDVVYT